MGSAGIAIGPDGKPLKRQEKRSQAPRGGVTKPGMKRGGMPMRPMRGGMGPGPLMGGGGFGGPGPFGPGGFGPGMRGPMPFAGPGRNMGFGPADQNVSFFKGPQAPVPSGVPPGVPPPPFMIPPPIPGKDAKRIRFNDEESDENELFAKLLYKKLRSITSKKRLEILHVSIMEMVRQAQEEDERERAATGMDPAVGPAMG
ncbi:hypothetical protein ANCCAN_20566 [Ancylostoma caninum]|uniref:Uncharacterized protein n=1 Tax=Ancylostoma caninum TaxID=29170 RepID=A0A368FN93_ANCCA|nr:hypothetical protein ANCCAN_20566 [Ancylostoma caninum]